MAREFDPRDARVIVSEKLVTPSLILATTLRPNVVMRMEWFKLMQEFHEACEEFEREYGDRIIPEYTSRDNRRRQSLATVDGTHLSVRRRYILRPTRFTRFKRWLTLSR